MILKSVEKILVLLAVVLLVSCGRENGTADDKRHFVNVVEASEANVRSDRSYSFVSKPYRTTDLSFRVGGPVNKFEVQPGQFFRKGQLIAAIDDRDFLVSRNNAEAVFNHAKAEYERISNLYEKGNISGSIYEKAKADYLQSKAALENAENALQDTKLCAPFDGYVQEVYIERYQEVRPSATVVSFIDLSKIKVETFIPEDVASSVKSGNASGAYVTFNTLKGEKFEVSESFISQSAMENNISYMFTAIVENSGDKLLGGMSGELHLPSSVSGKSLAVVVPQSAVVNREETGTYVWTLDGNDCVKQTPVKVGSLLNGNLVEITEGLAVGEKVVVNNVHNLSDGENVKLIK